MALYTQSIKATKAKIAQVTGKAPKNLPEMLDIDIDAHCPLHGAGTNEIRELQYPDGDIDYTCWCGHHLAYSRSGKLYVREEDLI